VGNSIEDREPVLKQEAEMVNFVTREIVKWAEQRGYGLYRVMRMLGYVTVACAETIDLEGEDD
jgi:hypothetical protein